MHCKAFSNFHIVTYAHHTLLLHVETVFARFAEDYLISRNRDREFIYTTNDYRRQELINLGLNTVL